MSLKRQTRANFLAMIERPDSSRNPQVTFNALLGPLVEDYR